MIQVPQVEHYDDVTQLHGRFIVELKKKWQCQTHHGEPGEPGYCNVSASGEHIRLNMLCLKTWAASMVYHICILIFQNLSLSFLLGCWQSF